MPIFEYKCKHCGQTIEKIKRIPTDEITCPACNNVATRTVSLTSSSSSNAACNAPTGGGFT